MANPIEKNGLPNPTIISEDEEEVKDFRGTMIARQIVESSTPKAAQKRSYYSLDSGDNESEEKRKVCKTSGSARRLDNESSRNPHLSYFQSLSSSSASGTLRYTPPNSPQHMSKSTATEVLTTPPSTPPRTTTRYISIPPTPRRNKKPPRPKFPFSIESRAALSESPLEIEKWIKLLDPKNQCDRILNIQGLYDLDRPLLCIKQPPQKQSCGAGAAIMLISHLIPNNPELLKEEFWDWYCNVSLASTEVVMTALRERTCLSELNHSVKGIYFNRQSTIDLKNKFEKQFDGYSYEAIQRRDLSLIHRLDQLQEENENSPLIVSITNPEIDGHWIVIDKFDHEKEQVYFRDPFTGHAYAISYEELYRNWPEDDEVKIIYLAPKRKSIAAH